jgi:hypothetical protein
MILHSLNIKRKNKMIRFILIGLMACTGAHDEPQAEVPTQTVETTTETTTEVATEVVTEEAPASETTTEVTETTSAK